VTGKSLQKHHLGHEMCLLCALLDKMILSNSHFINTEACEMVCRRIYGLIRAFSEVHQESDWKAPKNPGSKWKTKVRWDLQRAIDIYSLEQDGLLIQNVEKELAERLKNKATIARAFASSPTIQEEEV
jgi:hypothetical protein